MVADAVPPDDADMVPDPSSRAHRPRPELLATFAAVASTLITGIVFGLAMAPLARAQAIPDSAAAPAPAPRSIERTPATMPRGIADTVTVLPPVNVGGERTLVPGRSTATEGHLSRGEINRFRPATAGDALLAVPGVELSKTGPWSSRVSLRGLGGDRVLVMVDGVRVNTERGHGAQTSIVSIDRLDQVELLPGASSAQFGSDAMGGVINLITHRDLFSDQPRATLSLSTGGSQPGAGWDQSGRLRVGSGNWGFEAFGSLNGLQHLQAPDSLIANSGYREHEYGARVQARLGLAVLDFEHTYHAATDVGLPAFSDANGSGGNYPLQSRYAERFEAVVPGTGRRPELRMLAVYQGMHTDFNEKVVDIDSVRSRPVGVSTIATADRIDSPGWSLQPALRWAGEVDLHMTGELQHEETAGPRRTTDTQQTMSGAVVNQEQTDGVSIPPARRDAGSASAFAGRTFRLARLEAGLRWDQIRTQADEMREVLLIGGQRVTQPYHRDVTDQKLSGEAGLSRRFAAVVPYVHVASGFRGPNLQERYFDNTIHGGMRVFGNPDLVPERSMSYEAGIRIGESGGGRVTSVRVSAYRSDVEDLINLKYDGLNRGLADFKYINIDRARLEGFELASQFRFGWLGVGLNVAVPHGRDRDTGEKLVDSGVARTTLDLAAPVRLIPNGRIALRTRWTDGITANGLRGSFEAVNSLTRPAFWTGSLELSSLIAGFLATVAVNNVSDTYYREPLSFIPEPGRTVAVSLRRDFNLSLTPSRTRQP